MSLLLSLLLPFLRKTTMVLDGCEEPLCSLPAPVHDYLRTWYSDQDLDRFLRTLSVPPKSTYLRLLAGGGRSDGGDTAGDGDGVDDRPAAEMGTDILRARVQSEVDKQCVEKKWDPMVVERVDVDLLFVPLHESSEDQSQGRSKIGMLSLTHSLTHPLTHSPTHSIFSIPAGRGDGGYCVWPGHLAWGRHFYGEPFYSYTARIELIVM